MGLIDTDENATRACGLLSVLASVHRVKIAKLLLDRGEMTVNDIVAAIGLTQSATSAHLTVFKEAEILTRIRAGQLRLYSITPSYREIIRRLLDIAYEFPVPEYKNAPDGFDERLYFRCMLWSKL